MSCSLLNDLIAPALKERNSGNEERIRALPVKCGEASFKLAFCAGLENLYLPADCAGSILKVSQLVRACDKARIHQHSDRRRVRQQFVQHSEPFGFQCGAQEAHTRRIAAGTVEACHKPELDWVRA